MISTIVIEDLFLIDGSLMEATWVCVMILTFPLIVPLPPAIVAIASSLCALTVPLGARSVSWRTGEVFGWIDYVGALVNPAICAGIATFGAWVVYSFGVDASRGRELGAYKLEEALGRGGMGDVWRATHSMLKRPTAVKLIRLHASQSEEDARVALERFEHEAQATAALRSAHTLEVYDFGVTRDGDFYYVMEPLDGINLHDRELLDGINLHDRELLDGINLHDMAVRHDPLPAERIVWIAEQVCHSMGEAHSIGVTHRDIKLANIVLCRYGRDEDYVKVVDFGLVKAVDAPVDSRLTAEERVPDTPAFLASELVEAPDQIDGRADIYALGCVLYCLLVGAVAFPIETPMQAVVKHVSDAPTPPSSRSECEIPPALEELVMACLAKTPQDRPKTTQEVVNRLRAVRPDREWTQARDAY
ncbi:MAG: serine/threonine-protein kinase [Bradymonadia bacterium]|jgi:serine/threonine-protein kinase